MNRSLLLLALVAACQSKQSTSGSGLPAANDWNADPTAAIAAPVGGAAPHGTIHTDVNKLGLPPPDPHRTMDPNHHLRGVIRAPADAKVATGTAVFIVAKRTDASGAPSGPPVAVKRLTWGAGDLPFELSEANAMIGGTQLDGKVVLTAHYDHDGDALTKTSGDLIGQATVTVPDDHVELALTTVVP